jgi:DNA-directed RNA polymerase I, II, and III subunit RPABC3
MARSLIKVRTTLPVTPHAVPLLCRRSPPPLSLLTTVSRIKARSDLYEMDLVLDINVDVYPVSQGDRLTVCLATTLNLDGTPMPTAKGQANTFEYDPTIGTRDTLADRYEYVMFGRVFKYKDSSASGHTRADVYVSFGGLLMQLTGDPKRVEELDLDQTVYLLVRKV